MSSREAQPPAPDTAPSTDEEPESSSSADDVTELPSPFPHPPWTVGLVLVAGVITLLFGVLVNPIWLLVGSPFVVVLVLWLYVRLFVGR